MPGGSLRETASGQHEQRSAILKIPLPKLVSNAPPAEPMGLFELGLDPQLSHDQLPPATHVLKDKAVLPLVWQAVQLQGWGKINIQQFCSRLFAALQSPFMNCSSRVIKSERSLKLPRIYNCKSNQEASVAKVGDKREALTCCLRPKLETTTF